MSQFFLDNATGTILSATINPGAGPEAFIGLDALVAGEGANSFLPSVSLDSPETQGDYFNATLVSLDGTKTEIIKVVEIDSGNPAIFKGYRGLYDTPITTIADFIGGTMEIRLIAEDITCMNQVMDRILTDGSGNVLVDGSGNVLVSAC